jgi:hypothetical protein
MDDLSPGARSLLQAADTYDDPSPEDAARVRRAVLARVGAIGVTAAVITAGSTQAKAASVMSIAAKLTAALAVTAGGVAVTWTYANHDREVAQVSAPAPVKAKAPPVVGQAPVPAAEAPIVTPEVLEQEAPAVKGPRPLPRAPRAEAAVEKPVKAEPTPADLEAEMKLIRGADSALRAGRASEALSLLAQHQADHPRASLAHEREGLRAIAACQLGSAGSTATAQRFIERSPRSPLAPRLRSACRINE